MTNFHPHVAFVVSAHDSSGANPPVNVEIELWDGEFWPCRASAATSLRPLLAPLLTGPNIWRDGFIAPSHGGLGLLHAGHDLYPLLICSGVLVDLAGGSSRARSLGPLSPAHELPSPHTGPQCSSVCSLNADNGPAKRR